MSEEIIVAIAALAGVAFGKLMDLLSTKLGVRLEWLAWAAAFAAAAYCLIHT